MERVRHGNDRMPPLLHGDYDNKGRQNVEKFINMDNGLYPGGWDRLLIWVVKQILSILFCCGSILSAWAGGDWSEDLKSGALWDMPLKEFAGKYLKNERGEWVDQGKTTLRIARPRFTVGSIKLGETLISVEKGKLSHVQAMLYNKGDNGEIAEKEFEALVDASVAALDGMTEQKARPYKPSRKESAVRIKGSEWKWDKGTAILEASSTGKGSKFEPEFVRLKLGADEQTLMRGSSGERAVKDSLKSHVKKIGAQGAVIEGIPMVDQGQKGYCVVATAARIFSYYGMDYIDQHQLASIADASGDGGTSVSKMVEALKKIGSRFQIRVRDIDSLLEYKDYLRLIKEYNRAARKLDKPKFESKDVVSIWEKGDAEVLKQARCSSEQQMERWIKPIKQYVDAGIPVFWSVQLGLVPEPMRISQTRGGHMRLITGYDMEKKVIYFSDSWGSEHTCKEMPVDNAAAITICRLVVMPTK